MTGSDTEATGASPAVEKPVLPPEATLGEAIERLVSLTRLLRERCPWDRAQTHATIVPHTVEEALEVADLVRDADELDPGLLALLEDELGDLLFQVVLLSELSSELSAARDLRAVVQRIHDKLVRRHPHIFGELEHETADEVRRTWESVKRTAEDRSGIFHSLPVGFPATLHARKAQMRAASVGFDFPSVGDAIAKLDEERSELQAPVDAEIARRGALPGEDSGASREVHHEIGDLLFATINLARLLRVDPEAALRDCTNRFVSRVEEAARIAASAGEDFANLDLDAQERCYRAAKAARGEPDDPRS